ncbi:MAG TPA: hypothetical protein EYO78_10765 [Gammaproteobacteria bacterium]|nr:hypothetical protein [Gammaproteobacteria bacterium]
MGATINNLPQIQEVTERLGYEASLADDALIVKIGKFPAILTIDGGRLSINCKVARAGDIPEANQADFATAALDANTRLSPYALAMITDIDDPSSEGQEDDWPIVLTDTIPLGDFEECELKSALSDLQAALVGSKEVLQIAFAGSEPAAT